MSRPIDPELEAMGCPTQCKVFFQKRVGRFGGFYYCHRCKKTISENEHGEVSEPAGICSVCGGLEFWRVDSSGKKFKACWSPEKHRMLPK